MCEEIGDRGRSIQGECEITVENVVVRVKRIIPTLCRESFGAVMFIGPGGDDGGIDATACEDALGGGEDEFPLVHAFTFDGSGGGDTTFGGEIEVGVFSMGRKREGEPGVMEFIAVGVGHECHTAVRSGGVFKVTRFCEITFGQSDIDREEVGQPTVEARNTEARGAEGVRMSVKGVEDGPVFLNHSVGVDFVNESGEEREQAWAVFTSGDGGADQKDGAFCVHSFQKDGVRERG